jgi:hypothetical protein
VNIFSFLQQLIIILLLSGNGYFIFCRINKSTLSSVCDTNNNSVQYQYPISFPSFHHPAVHPPSKSKTSSTAISSHPSQLFTMTKDNLLPRRLFAFSPRGVIYCTNDRFFTWIFKNSKLNELEWHLSYAEEWHVNAPSHQVDSSYQMLMHQ